MRRLKLTIFLAVFAIVASLQSATVTFDKRVEFHTGDQFEVSYDDWQMIQISRNLSLPVREFVIELNENQTIGQITIGEVQTISLGQIPEGVDCADAPTSLDSYYDQFLPSILKNRLGSETVHFLGETSIQGKRYARFLLFPVTVDVSGYLHRCDSLTLIDERGGTVERSLVLPYSEIAQFQDDDRSGERASLSPQSSAYYVIITNSALVNSFELLSQYKTQTGYRVTTVLVEEILATYSGRDSAESVREYLKQFHAEGGRYVLLGGDETIVPIRYAYNSDADIPVDPRQLQVSDLYYADLTGEWNRDNDSVWGERTHDAPDLSAELMVGRLPINTPEEVVAYTNKLIRYETNPGNGDRSYLNRAFFFSSDQMRDYSPTNQHTYIARAYPSTMTIDTTNGVEAVRGDDPAPSNLPPRDLGPILSQGFGIVNILAHGRDDGFAVRTVGYNSGSRGMLWTNAASGDHNTFANLQAVDRPAFYYSLACDNGGFDYSSPPFNYGTRNMAQELIAERDGAVGLVAYSRWGWIGTSYLLQRAFFDSLFAHADRPAVQAMNAVKARYYYYRDLILGQNFFGDPTLRVYTAVPKRLTMQAIRIDDTTLRVTVFADSQPSANCRIIVSDSGGIVAELTTDDSGNALLPIGSEISYPVCFSAIGTESTIGQIWYAPSIVTDVEDDGNMLPKQFSLSQNYPNPFNPSTQIRFTLPTASHARLIVYDLLGREVSTLIDGLTHAGEHQVRWTARDNSGNDAASGVYFYRLTADDKCETKKMLLLK